MEEPLRCDPKGFRLPALSRGKRGRATNEESDLGATSPGRGIWATPTPFVDGPQPSDYRAGAYADRRIRHNPAEPANGEGYALALPLHLRQHPDEHGAERPVLLAVLTGRWGSIRHRDQIGCTTPELIETRDQDLRA
jgi:hypothetical protein